MAQPNLLAVSRDEHKIRSAIRVCFTLRRDGKKGRKKLPLGIGRRKLAMKRSKEIKGSFERLEAQFLQRLRLDRLHRHRRTRHLCHSSFSSDDFIAFYKSKRDWPRSVTWRVRRSAFASGGSRREQQLPEGVQKPEKGLRTIPAVSPRVDLPSSHQPFLLLFISQFSLSSMQGSLNKIIPMNPTPNHIELF